MKRNIHTGIFENKTSSRNVLLLSNDHIKSEQTTIELIKEAEEISFENVWVVDTATNYDRRTFRGLTSNRTEAGIQELSNIKDEACKTLNEFRSNFYASENIMIAEIEDEIFINENPEYKKEMIFDIERSAAHLMEAEILSIIDCFALRVISDNLDGNVSNSALIIREDIVSFKFTKTLKDRINVLMRESRKHGSLVVFITNDFNENNWMNICEICSCVITIDKLPVNLFKKLDSELLEEILKDIKGLEEYRMAITSFVRRAPLIQVLR